jgi:UDP-N-acetylmuramoylalanine--D-glutamate ligase
MSSSQHQRIAVLGAVRSGFGAARLAAREGAAVTLFDEADEGKMQQALATAKTEGFGIKVGAEAREALISAGEYDLAILSPGFDVNWPLPQKFAHAGVPLTGETEFGFVRCDLPMVAITGTNGKSTTTEIMSDVFNRCGKRSLPCGNHGRALCEVLVSGEAYDVLSLEVSSFQLETIERFRPQVSVWLNFAPDHLDRYPDVEAYFAAKVRIFKNQTEQDYAVIHAQEVSRIGSVRPTVITFSAQPGDEADYTYSEQTFFFRGQVIGTARGLRLRGRHNMENVLAALAAGHIMGLAHDEMLAAVAEYEPPKHRCELVRVWNEREFINDSKATNLHALESCVRSLDQQIVLVLGGKEKGLDYTPLSEVVRGRVRAFVLIGEIASALEQQFSAVLPCVIATDMAKAVDLAAGLSQAGDAIVLSPGTSSFDMYSGYAERGEHFRRAVLSLN